MWIDGNAMAINALFFQGIQDKTAETIVADAADPAHFQAQTREAGGDVKFCPRDALNESFNLFQIAGL